MGITALYAGLLTPLFLALTIRVIRGRRATGAAIGDGGNPDLLRRMRVQANFAETVPLALILLGLAESLATSAWLLHVLGASLLLGRLSHAFGVSRTPEDYRFRVTGMALTCSMLGIGAIVCLAQAAGIKV